MGPKNHRAKPNQSDPITRDELQAVREGHRQYEAQTAAYAAPILRTMGGMVVGLLLLLMVPRIIRFIAFRGQSPEDILRDFKKWGYQAAQQPIWGRLFKGALVAGAVFLLSTTKIEFMPGPMIFLFTGMGLWLSFKFFAWIWRSVFSNRRKAHGDAKFEAPTRILSRREQAVAGMVVRHPDSSQAERGFVAPAAGRAHAKVLYLDWPTISQHLLIVGNSGSGKTSTIYSHLMLSGEIPWIYQDTKADLPLRDRFPNRAVWGLDTRGYVTRSAVWNPMEEIRSAEDVELLAQFVFPERGDQNDWIVRASRGIFADLIKAKPWASLQEIGAAFIQRPIDELLKMVGPGWRSATTDPRVKGYFVQELLEKLRPWLDSRVAEISEGRSTVTLDQFIQKGGYVLSNDRQELRTPVKLFWAWLLFRLRNRPDGSTRIMLLMDEFGDAGKIPGMAEALALYRSKGVGIIAGIQTYSLMDMVYSQEGKAVRDGFGNTFILAQNLPLEMASQLSQQLGTWTKTRMNWNVGMHGPSIGSTQDQGVSLVSPGDWATWGSQRACIARIGSLLTWWVGQPINMKPAPLGAPKEVATDWRAEEAARMARYTASAATMKPGRDDLDDDLEALGIQA